MTLEELIVAWSQTRPTWQREVMSRVATGDKLSDADYDELVKGIVEGRLFSKSTFGIKQLPQTTPNDPSVRLVAIDKLQHVNALESSLPLRLEPKGLTIIFGDNGSGKSGYARLLKRITRARHQEDVLSDVFRDASLANPTAELSILIGDDKETVDWPGTGRPDLKRILFYDGACGSAYVSSESEFPYRPSALFVMDGLIEACDKVRSRIEVKLESNLRSINILPTIPEDAKNTSIGRFLTDLSGQSLAEDLDALIIECVDTGEVIQNLKKQEATMQSADPAKEKKKLKRQGEKLGALRKHLERLNAVLGDKALMTLQQHRDNLLVLEQAGAVLARSLESEPLPGVGSSPWKILWESARRFSEESAYLGETFPVLNEDSRCVLCLQTFEKDERDRFARFDRFVKDDAQVQLKEALSTHDAQIARLTELDDSPEEVKSNLQDLEMSHSELVAETRSLLACYQEAQAKILDAIASSEKTPRFGIDPGNVRERLRQATDATTSTAACLGSPDGIQKRLVELGRRRIEHELIQEAKKSREAVVKEIERRRERDALEAAKTAAATGAITRKINEFSEESITEVIRETFATETDRLRLERVTITRTRSDKGVLHHQPKLEGARQEVTLPRVFSEGERTALGLASFFTEARLDASKSALILDDPVNSLDHVRRGLVATRLAAFAVDRQVVVFTHDLSFVADLNLEGAEKEVQIAALSVSRSRAGDRKPGSCGKGHPWKAKVVAACLNELGASMAQIKKECSVWDDKRYEVEVALWAGKLSETWERIFSQEIVGRVLANGGLEVRPMMVRLLARFTETDHAEFDASYGRLSRWAKRHDKSVLVNYVPPDVAVLEQELQKVEVWFDRVRRYKN